MANRFRSERPTGSAQIGRLSVVGVIIVGIAVQVGAIALGAGPAFWPFLRYPMYATAGESGFTHRELCVRVDGESFIANGWDLGITSFRHLGMLTTASRDTPAGERVRGVLSRRAAAYFGPGATLELREAIYDVGPDGLVDPSPPWVLARTWEGPSEADAPERATRPTLKAWRDRVTSGQCGGIGR